MMAETAPTNRILVNIQVRITASNCNFDLLNVISVQCNINILYETMSTKFEDRRWKQVVGQKPRMDYGPGRTGLVTAGVEDAFSLVQQHAARPYTYVMYHRFETGMLCDD